MKVLQHAGRPRGRGARLRGSSLHKAAGSTPLHRGDGAAGARHGTCFRLLFHLSQNVQRYTSVCAMGCGEQWAACRSAAHRHANATVLWQPRRRREQLAQQSVKGHPAKESTPHATQNTEHTPQTGGTHIGDTQKYGPGGNVHTHSRHAACTMQVTPLPPACTVNTLYIVVLGKHPRAIGEAAPRSPWAGRIIG